MNNDLIITCICGKHKTSVKENKDLVDFLEQSNLIEGVTDTDSLIQAFEAWSYLIEQPKLTLGVVLKTHKILMLHQPIRPDEKGYLRQRIVYIGGIAKPSGAIRQLMEVWLKQMKVKSKYNKKYKEVLSKKLHVHYEAIHPFIDGNGRTGRMFMNYWRLQNGLPLFVVWDKDKELYYHWFI